MFPASSNDNRFYLDALERDRERYVTNNARAQAMKPHTRLVI